MKNVFDNVLAAIGQTPMIRLASISRPGSHTYWAKVEYFNPGGSVKDRVGLAMIEAAEKAGKLKPGGVIVEATSGNTGLGLAMVAAIKGYRCIFVMPDKISEEKRAILRAYGAEVIITPTAVDHDDPQSYLSVCKRIAKETPGSVHIDQYNNPANPLQHYLTTGPEIWEQTSGQIDVFVGGGGTGGTVSGVGRFLKEKNPKVQVVLADPVGSILNDLYYHGKALTPPQPYKVEGVGEDMLPENFHFKYMDGVVSVDDKASFLMTRQLIKTEGLCLGPSSAMAVVAAQKWAEKLTKASNIVVLFPDNGRGYLSKVFNDQWMKENGFL